MIRQNLVPFALGLILASVIHPLPTLAHSTVIEYKMAKAITIEAKFDGGLPMSNAQVVIYAPDKPTQPWQKGVTDEQGVFTFIPDYQNQGDWTIKVRSAGHGNVINIPIKPMDSSAPQSETISSPPDVNPNQNSPLSASQKILMAAMGSWGFIGTALFFSRKNNTIN